MSGIQPGPVAGRTVTVVLITAASALSAWLAGRAVSSVAGDREAPWLIGRASGVSCYLLLVLLVAIGLGLSHPWRSRLRTPSTAARIRIHVSLAVFTLAFLVLHIVVLATDSYAKVGWAGALLPLQSEYRPVPITLGVLGAWAGLLSGLTAAFAGSWAARVWFGLHKVSSVTLVLVWLHAVFAGTDTLALLVMYIGTGVAVLALAAWRYLTSAPLSASSPSLTPARTRASR